MKVFNEIGFEDEEYMFPEEREANLQGLTIRISSAPFYGALPPDTDLTYEVHRSPFFLFLSILVSLLYTPFKSHSSRSLPSLSLSYIEWKRNLPAWSQCTRDRRGASTTCPRAPTMALPFLVIKSSMLSCLFLLSFHLLCHSLIIRFYSLLFIHFYSLIIRFCYSLLLFALLIIRNRFLLVFYVSLSCRLFAYCYVIGAQCAYVTSLREKHSNLSLACISSIGIHVYLMIKFLLLMINF